MGTPRLWSLKATPSVYHAHYGVRLKIFNREDKQCNN